MDLDLKGKRAIVSGASRGIGLAIARTLLAEGASVGVCARGEEHLNEVSAELSSSERFSTKQSTSVTPTP